MKALITRRYEEPFIARGHVGPFILSSFFDYYSASASAAAQYTKLAPSTTFRSVSDYMALHYRYKLAREQVWPFIAVWEPR